MCRSWTSRTPCDAAIASPTSVTSIPRGADSSSTSSGSRISRHDPSRIRQPISIAATASASSGPPAAMTTPATRAPSEPSASAAEWRRTPSRLRSPRSPRARMIVAITLPIRPKAPTAAIPSAVHVGWVGEARRWPRRTPRWPLRPAATPFANAAKISARRSPNVWRPRAGRAAAQAAADAEPDRADVRQHVARVREQGDRVEQQPAGDRGGQHRQVDGQRDRHPAGVAGAGVGVSVMGVHAVSLAHCLR